MHQYIDLLDPKCQPNLPLYTCASFILGGVATLLYTCFWLYLVPSYILCACPESVRCSMGKVYTRLPGITSGIPSRRRFSRVDRSPFFFMYSRALLTSEKRGLEGNSEKAWRMQHGEKTQRICSQSWPWQNPRERIRFICVLVELSLLVLRLSRSGSVDCVCELFF